MGKAIVGIITILLLGTLYNFVPAPEDTHFCEDRMISHSCNLGLSKYYSLPNGKCLSSQGNKLCRSGWVEITESMNDKQIIQYSCNNKECVPK